MEPLDQAKVIAMVVLAVVSLILGLIPIWLVKRLNWKMNGQAMPSRAKNILSGLLCFGAGVLMSTALTHLLPEVHEGVGELQEEGYVTESLPLAEIFFSAGFFLVYLVEELVHWVSDKHAHSKTDVSIHRSVGVRECAVSKDGQPVPPHSNAVHDDSTSSSSCHSHCDEQIKETSSSSSTINTVSGEVMANDKSFDSLDRRRSSVQHHHHHNHHHHVIGDGDRVTPSLRGLLVVIGLSLHEVFEGMAIGLENSTGDVYTLFAAVASHKFVIVFCVGIEMATSGVKVKMHVFYMVVLALITSLGIGIGMAVTDSGHNDALTLTTLVLQGLAGGTLIYVAFFEVLERERSKSTVFLLQWTCLLLGYLALVGLQALIPEPEGGHSHGHTDESTTEGLKAVSGFAQNLQDSAKL